tara:strand:- start:269 stop:799 length:531 start_codon:yes stop_codon:yes gene_type:complete
METYRTRSQSRSSGFDSFEIKFDKLIETGRQVVDGVAGNRPGKRKSEKIGLRSASNFNNVGRWVEEKLDWFFEEEDDWLEPWESDLATNSNMNTSKKKRPLQAISLRGPKAIASASNGGNNSESFEVWPDDSSFRIQRWQRENNVQNSSDRNLEKASSDSRFSTRRPLPRSSRRRN